MNSSEAAEALEDGNLELALEKYSAAIALGTDSALLYSRRAQVLQWQSSFSNCSPASFSSCIAFCFSTRSWSLYMQCKVHVWRIRDLHFV